MSKFIIFLFAFSGMILTLEISVQACTQSMPILSDFQSMAVSADAVFTAKTLHVEAVPIMRVIWTSKKTNKPILSSEKGQKVSFEIKQMAKGAVGSNPKMLFKPSKCTWDFLDLLYADVIVFAFKSSFLISQKQYLKPNKHQSEELELIAEANRFNKDLPDYEIIGFPVTYFKEKELEIILSTAKYAKP